jgi:subtilisin family serine protease
MSIPIAVPGLAGLWTETLGDPRVCVALLDGPVDLAHPSLRGASLTQLDSVAGTVPVPGDACRHGIQVASILFGQPSGPVHGIAPHCRGLSIPLFAATSGTGTSRCSQLDLARAISLAVQQGAQVINISGGQLVPLGAAYPLLATVVRECTRRDVLIVAAAGNEGCECLHVPAALEAVLAVGAMNAHGEPLPSSNWGPRYQTQGILAPGEDILGARAGGGTLRGTGTSYATAVVSGVVALLLSLQRKHGRPASPHLVRAALLRTALGCRHQPVSDCRRLLAGRLNVNGAVSFLLHQGIFTMSETLAPQANETTNNHRDLGVASSAAQAGVQQSDGKPSACGCPTCQAAPTQLVYALGQLSYDLISEARLDSLTQSMASQPGLSITERAGVFDPHNLLAYLDQNPWDAAAVEWTLKLDGTPVYAIRPSGPFAAKTYEELRDFLKQQLVEGVERVSIPGVIAGKATLLMGQVVPVIEPELRGMRSWTTGALIQAVVGPAPAAEAPQQEKDAHAEKQAGLRDFLDRVYHEHRNLGMMPQDRALNFAATNAYQTEKVYESAMKEDMDLESIHVSRSPLCRPGSDCWDVELYFFYPERQVQTVRKVYRFTVDVSDVVPVTIGPTRSWFTR